jgi:hypothetical protein
MATVLGLRHPKLGDECAWCLTELTQCKVIPGSNSLGNEGHSALSLGPFSKLATMGSRDEKVAWQC